MMPVKIVDDDDKIFLLDYLDLHHLDHLECIPTNKKYYRFNHDIYINIQMDHHWERKNKANIKSVEKSFLELIDIVHQKTFNKEALILGI
uniref:Uncharacterized protein n=1 Tax=Strongyloides venezuelensis TaxID=75913 RepID=A0A0K0FW30_STRVS